MAREYERLTFMANRDGDVAANEFAERGIKIYGEAINAPPTKPNMAYSGPHKYKFIASVLVYEEFLDLVPIR